MNRDSGCGVIRIRCFCMEESLMKSLVIVILLLILLMIWILMTKKKLVVMDENVNLAMGQLGVQVSSQFDAAMLLVDLVKSYTEKDGSRLKKMIQTESRILTARSIPSDVLKQERVIQKVLDEISDISGEYPELKEDRGYAKCLDAVDSYKKMVRTSRLIYNDIVTKYNQAIRMVPTCLVAGILGFHKREYLESGE